MENENLKKKIAKELHQVSRMTRNMWTCLSHGRMSHINKNNLTFCISNKQDAQIAMAAIQGGHVTPLILEDSAGDSAKITKLFTEYPGSQNSGYKFNFVMDFKLRKEDFL